MRAVFSKLHFAAAAAVLVLNGAAVAQIIQTGPPKVEVPQLPKLQSPTVAEPVRAFQLSPSDTKANNGNNQVRSTAAPQPPNRLGQQVNSPVPVVMPSVSTNVDGPSVVYPRPDAVVEKTVRQIEDMQLTPNQYERLKGIFLEKQQQKATPYANPAKPVTRTLLVNLDPGISPPTLRLSRGQQTSLVFSDVSGQPWMIEKVSLNRQLFNDGRGTGGAVQGAPTAAGQGEPPTNVLSIEPLMPAAYGNVTVTLRGQSTPLIFMLTAGQTEVDMRVDAKVPGKNPDAEAEVSMQSAPSLDNALPYFLDGVPPTGAKRMRVNGLEGAEAWIYDKNLYVKARANAQYPAYLAAARSTNGVSVYRYVGVPKAATFTTGGRAMTAFFE